MNKFMVKRSTEGLNKVQLKSANAFNDFIDKLIKRDFTLIEEYKGSNKKVKVICDKGHEIYTYPYYFRRGRSCIRCKGMCPIQAKEQFIEVMNKEGYELVSEYKYSSWDITLRCPKGHEFTTLPMLFKKGDRCPYCNNRSYGESLVRDLLDKYKIKYFREKSYSDLKGLGGHVLRFDFYIPCINTLIEVQGEEHYEEYTVDYFEGDTLEHDKLKRKYCKQNNIRLIEIPYLSTIYGRDVALEKVKDRVVNIIKEIK